MALPTKGDCETLDYTMNGAPYAGYDISADVSSDTLDFTMNGAPFVLAQYVSLTSTFFIYTVVS